MTKYSQKGVYSERKEFAPKRANSFSLRVDPNEMGGKNENDTELLPLKVCPFLKIIGKNSYSIF